MFDDQLLGIFQAKMSLQASQRFSFRRDFVKNHFGAQTPLLICCKEKHARSQIHPKTNSGFNELQKLKTFAWCRCWVCAFAVMLLRSIKLRAFDDYIKVLHPFLLFRPSSSLAGERSGFIVSCSLQKRKKCNDHVTSSTRERKERRCSAG